MSLFHKKKNVPEIPFDPDLQKPVIFSSICTGEKRAGFLNKASGKFQEVVYIRSPKDMENFLDMYGLKEEDVEIKY